MRAVFIRHGESTGNAGIPCDDLALMTLTKKGLRQARKVAEAWTEPPSLIVTSSYLRTQQTAAPTIERFPSVPVEVWPIQEFTYLEPNHWNGTFSVARKPYIDAYWEACDPEFCDGPGAESFTALLRRAEAALQRLEAASHDGQVFLFSHGQFIHAVRMIVLYPEASDREKMERFWRPDGLPAVCNAELVGIAKAAGKAPWILPAAIHGDVHNPPR
jgi:broad specificity phosphatase PhoE